MTLENIWNEVRDRHIAVDMDTDYYKATIYKGIKFLKDDTGVYIYCTDTEFYKDITNDFVRDSLDIGVREHLNKKYLKKLDLIGDAIKRNVNGTKNHRNFTSLKKKREFYLKKYNEINTEKITRG